MKLALNTLLHQVDCFEKRAQNNQALKILRWVFSNFLDQNLSIDDVTKWINNQQYFTLNDLINDEWRTNRYESPTHLKNKSGTIIFTLSPELPYSFKERTTSLIPKYGKFPNLWYSTGNVIPGADVRNTQLSMDLSHNYFLIKSLKYIFPTIRYDDFIISAEKFIKQNLNKINKLRAMFQKQPVMLGSGADGVVFSIGDNMILKIFTDEFSYQAAKAAYDRLHQGNELAKTEAVIYDVDLLGVFNNTNVYYYLMEKVAPVEDEDESAHLNKLTKVIARIITKDIPRIWLPLKLDISKYTSQELKKKITQYSTIYSHQLTEDYDLQDYIEKIQSKFKLKENFIELLVEEMIFKYLTSRGDLHLGNLGATNYGELRYFDPAHTDWQHKFNIYTGLTAPI